MTHLIIYWIFIGIAAMGRNNGTAKRTFVKLLFCITGSLAGAFIMKYYFGLGSSPSFTEAALSGAGALTGALIFRNGYRIVLFSSTPSEQEPEVDKPGLKTLIKNGSASRMDNGEPGDLSYLYFALKTHDESIAGGNNNGKTVFKTIRHEQITCLKMDNKLKIIK